MKTILIAEDEKPMAKALELKLTKAGFEVVVVGSGEDVMTTIASQSFDLILLDILMPGMNGFDVLQQLQGKNLKIIVTSNLGQPEDIVKAKSLGAIDYMIKSNVSLSDIVAKVTSFVGTP